MSYDKNPKTVLGNRIFQNVYPQDIKINVNSKNFIEVNEGEIIYQLGDNSDSLYLLLKGQVKIKVYDGVGGTSLIKKFADDFFGENELLEKTSRKSTAIAVEKSLVYFIGGNELSELTKNKTIRAKLFNSTSAIRSANQKSFNKLENVNELNINEYNSIDASNDKSSSSLASSSNKDDFDEGNNNLSWNTSNTDEFKDIFDDKDLLDNNEVDDYSFHDAAEIVYEKVDLSGKLDQPENSLQNIHADESELLFDTKETKNTNDNSKDLIRDRVKEEIKENIAESKDKQEADSVGSEEDINSTPSISEESKLDDKEQILPENISEETSSVESNMAPQEDQEQLSNRDYHEITKAVIESIYDEIKTPTELIKKYADLLLQKSSSAVANKALQKIIDQSNNIINSLQMHADYFSERMQLKTQVLYATNVLNDILHLLAGYTEFRKVKLFRKFEADASLLIDKNLFYQACLHIIKFLCENIEGEGNIFVTVSRTKETIIIEFKSNGPKLPDELLKKVSDYFMLKETPGLVFAKKIIAEHGGTILAQNSVDAGPEIKVLLPIVK